MKVLCRCFSQANFNRKHENGMFFRQSGIKKNKKNKLRTVPKRIYLQQPFATIDKCCWCGCFGFGCYSIIFFLIWRLCLPMHRCCHSIEQNRRLPWCLVRGYCLFYCRRCSLIQLLAWESMQNRGHQKSTSNQMRTQHKTIRYGETLRCYRVL